MARSHPTDTTPAHLSLPVARTSAGSVEATAHCAEDSVLLPVHPGSGVALTSRRGPDGGMATVSLDGDELGLLDLWDEEASGPEVVLALAVPGAEASVHRLEIRLDDGLRSVGSRVTIESFLVMGASAVG